MRMNAKNARIKQFITGYRGILNLDFAANSEFFLRYFKWQITMIAQMKMKQNVEIDVIITKTASGMTELSTTVISSTAAEKIVA